MNTRRGVSPDEAHTPPRSPRTASPSSLLPPSPLNPTTSSGATPPLSPLDNPTDALLRIIQRQAYGDALKEDWRAVPLSIGQYHRLLDIIAADSALDGFFNNKLRWDWRYTGEDDSGSGIFSLRMPTLKHDVFIDKLETRIKEEFRKTPAQVQTLVDTIFCARSADAHDTEGKVSADAGFAFIDCPFRLVQLEVAYSQVNNDDLYDLAERHIAAGSNTVITVNLEYATLAHRKDPNKPPKDASYCLYRVAEFEEDGKNYRRMEVIVFDQDFVNNPHGSLELKLSDFLPLHERPKLEENDHLLRIPHTVLDGFLQFATAQQSILDHQKAQPTTMLPTFKPSTTRPKRKAEGDPAPSSREASSQESTSEVNASFGSDYKSLRNLCHEPSGDIEFRNTKS